MATPVPTLYNFHVASGETSCLPDPKDGNVGIAFGIVTAAGLSTAIGAALAFVMPKSQGPTNLFLAGSLGLAAGVMLFVAFIEIFADKAVEHFELCLKGSLKSSYAFLYANFCFFSGIAITYLLEVALSYFEKWIVGRSPPNPDQDVEANGAALEESSKGHENKEEHGHVGGHEGGLVADVYANATDAKALFRMGIFAGIAIAIHNFPEGLATFVAVMDDPKVGASVAVAIALHNIPEGICVAIPIYYATGSKWKGFFWAFLSGISELFGALLGFAVLRRVLSQTVYGIIFGIVAGMMVYISLAQLLPTAHKYDPKDRVTTFSLIAGFIIMALSLVLFRF